MRPSSAPTLRRSIRGSLAVLLSLFLAGSGLAQTQIIPDVEDANDEPGTAPIVFLNNGLLKTVHGELTVECQPPATVVDGVCTAPFEDDDWFIIRGLRALDRVMIGVHPTADFVNQSAFEQQCDKQSPAGRYCVIPNTTTCISEGDCPESELCTEDGLCSVITFDSCSTDNDCVEGSCSITTSQSCRIHDDCPGSETCQGGQTCEENFPGYAHETDCFGEPDTFVQLYRLDPTNFFCSVTSTTPCTGHSDCPQGTCSVTTAQACNEDADCPATETCVGGETCGAFGTALDIFNGAECPFLENFDLDDPDFPFAPVVPLTDCLASADDVDNSDLNLEDHGSMLRFQVAEDGNYALFVGGFDLGDLGEYVLTITVDPNVQCNDGVDNDGDGLIDRLGGTGRFCTIDTTTACVTNGDCQPRCSVTSGTTCGVNTDCPQGTCQLSPGTNCNIDTDCPGSHCSTTTTTACTTDGDCPPGTCSFTTAQSCTVDLDCPPGFCSITTTVPCRDFTNCPGSGVPYCLSSGVPCITNNDCQAGLCSITTTQSCHVNADCPGGETCIAGDSCQPAETCLGTESCVGGESCVAGFPGSPDSCNGGETCQAQSCDDQVVAADLGCEDFPDISEQDDHMDNIDNDDDGEVDEADEAPVGCFAGMGPMTTFLLASLLAMYPALVAVTPLAWPLRRRKDDDADDEQA